jgi:hypothetical protein
VVQAGDEGDDDGYREKSLDGKTQVGGASRSEWERGLHQSGCL